MHFIRVIAMPKTNLNWAGRQVVFFASTLLLAGRAGAETPAVPEFICGPDVVLIGDAWENVQVEREEIRRLLQEGDLVRWPQKMAALVAHLRFMERKAVMVFGEERKKLARAVKAVADRRQATAELALAGDAEALRQEWQDLQTPIRVAGEQFPDEALIPTTSLAHLLPPVNPSIVIVPAPVPVLHPGVAAHITFRMNTFRRGDLEDKDLMVNHEAKAHAMVADLTLQDYHHAHPRPTGVPGEWAFDFTPRLAGPYRLWIDAVPVETGREEFAVVDLGARLENPVLPEAERQTEQRARSDGIEGELSFGPPLREGILAQGRLKLWGDDGRPLTTLEPVMGSFAHIVGIAGDLHTVLHIHPHGPALQAADRGGPEVDFRLRPAAAGFYRLFVQVQTEGRIRCLRFGINVNLRDEAAALKK